MRKAFSNLNDNRLEFSPMFGQTNRMFWHLRWVWISTIPSSSGFNEFNPSPHWWLEPHWWAMPNPNFFTVDPVTPPRVLWHAQVFVLCSIFLICTPLGAPRGDEGRPYKWPWGTSWKSIHSKWVSFSEKFGWIWMDNLQEVWLRRCAKVSLQDA